jgi:hypothetical protein
MNRMIPYRRLKLSFSMNTETLEERAPRARKRFQDVASVRKTVASIAGGIIEMEHRMNMVVHFQISRASDVRTS